MPSMRGCAVLSCDSHKCDRDPAVSFHSIPKKEAYAKEWLHFLSEANVGYQWKSRKNMLICSKHFQKCCIYETLLTNRVSFGHIPSILDGKVLVNPKSKCKFQLPDERMTHFKRPLSYAKRASDARREFLLSKLNSFPVAEIVIGKPPLVRLPTSPSSSGAQNASQAGSFASSSMQGPVAGTSQKLLNRSAYEMSRKKASFYVKDKSDPIFEMSEDVELEIVPIKHDYPDQNFSKRKSSFGSSIKIESSAKHSPKSQKKIKRLELENQTLRKTLKEVETTMKEMESEIVSLKTTSIKLEKRHLGLCQSLKNTMSEMGLRKIKRQASHRLQTIRKKVSTCVDVDIVDISND